MLKLFFRSLAPALAVILCSASASLAHFGMLIPSASTVMDKKDASLTLDIAFSHPAASRGMDMRKPAAFSVHVNGKSENLADSLKPAKFLGSASWRAGFEIKKPGVYQFAVTPEPYFEPAEDCFIIHYTKTAVAAYGAEDGWDEPLGLPVEIVPLARPFGNYAGNVFQGIVLKNGKPQAGVSVEIECLDGGHAAPDAYYEAQIARTDANGVFTAGIPWAGWWGFAALVEGDEKIELEGQPKNVELGGVLWIEAAGPLSGKRVSR